jgi:hypothetical protein
MLGDRGRAKHGPDHKPLRGVWRPATCMNPPPLLSSHARLSGSTLLPLSQVHPSAQLDLAAKGIQLRGIARRPAAWSSPDTPTRGRSERQRQRPPADPDRSTERVPGSHQTRRSGPTSPDRPHPHLAVRRGSGAPLARVPRQRDRRRWNQSRPGLAPLVQFRPAVLWAHRPSRATPILQDRMPILQSLRLILCKRPDAPNGCAGPLEGAAPQELPSVGKLSRLAAAAAVDSLVKIGPRGRARPRDRASGTALACGQPEVPGP